MKESFLTIKNQVKTEYVIEKSKFIATVCPVDSDEKAKNFIQRIKKEYSDATHNCYGYLVDNNGTFMKFSDDGEPQGTAGLPILEAIKSKNLVNVAIVVTRYFGGIKLGTGGLVRAYFESAKRGLEDAEISPMVLCGIYFLNVPYSTYKSILKIVENNAKIIKTDYLNDSVYIEFYSPLNNEENFNKSILNLSSGKLSITKISEEYKVF